MLANECRALVLRISACAKSLLPPKNDTGSYSTDDVYRILAFRLFAHAEIEGFLEDCAQTLVDAISNKNESSTLPNKLRSHILLHRDLVNHYPPLKLNRAIHPDDRKHIRGVLNGQTSIISNNNGVSEKDVIKLFSPLGFDWSAFDTRWLSSMQDLARRRGEVAHRSVVLSTTIQPTPEEERRLLVIPLLGIRRLADAADGIMATL